MKKMLFVISVLLLLAACQKLNGEVTMKPSETLSNNDVSLKFLEYSDSRCPEGAQCITSGAVTVWMELQSDTATVQFAIGDEESSFDEQYSAMNYTVRFVDLTPHPQDGKTIKSGQIRLHLVVTKQ